MLLSRAVEVLLRAVEPLSSVSRVSRVSRLEILTPTDHGIRKRGVEAVEGRSRVCRGFVSSFVSRCRGQGSGAGRTWVSTIAQLLATLR